MKRRNIFLIPTLLLIVFGCQSTEEPNPQIDKPLIQGNWVLLEAKRNKRITETLKDAYFTFSNDTTLQTNILGDTQDQIFEWVDSSLVVNESLAFKVQFLKSDTMLLSFKIKTFDFDLLLNKSNANVSNSDFAPSTK